MASIWKKKGSWYIRPRGGKPACLGPIAEDLARSHLRVMKLREEDRRGAAVNPGFMRFADVLEDFLAEKKTRREASTHRCYRTHRNNFVRLFPCGLRIGEIRPEHVSRYMDARVAEGVAKGRKADGVKRTANKERITLGTIFTWALRRQLVERNPVDAVPPYSTRPDPIEPCPPALHREVVDALRADAAAHALPDERHVRELVADLHEVFWWTGWRLGEGCALLVEDVDLGAQGGPTCMIRSARNKGGGVAYPIPKQIIAILKRRCAGRSAGFVFLNSEGRKAYRSVENFWKRWLRKHPTHRAANFHRSRHAFTSDLERAGVDPRTSQGLTRHKTLSMLGHYSHRGLDELRQAQGRLAESRSRRPTKKRRPS